MYNEIQETYEADDRKEVILQVNIRIVREVQKRMGLTKKGGTL
jgi:hypothetical protein